MAARSLAPSRSGTSLQRDSKTSQVLGAGAHGRILCLADIRGKLSTINHQAEEVGAVAVIHTGDFGFFDESSLDRINDRTLRHLILYSPLVSSAERDELLAEGNTVSAIRSSIASSSSLILSELPQLLSGEIKLSVPVYTVWGACEDVSVLEKFRSGEYDVENLHILDEAATRSIDVGGVKLRLLGLGGALVPHKMFDNGDGRATIAGGQGTMWTTALQIGELVDTAQRSYDQSETRLFISHASPGREGLVAQLALVLKADLTISAGLHFRYASSYNEFSVQSDPEGFRHKLASGKDSFDRVWENVKSQVEAVIDENQRILLEKCLSVVERVPPALHGGAPSEEPAWKNCWNWNLCDAAYGHLVLDVKEGRVSSELKSQGFNYAYRRKIDSSISAPQPNANPSPNAGKASSPHEPNSLLPADTTPKINGASTGSTEPSSPVIGSDKPSKKKPAKKERERDKDRKDDLGKGIPGSSTEVDRSSTPLSSAAARPLPRSNAASPAPSASAHKTESDVISPIESSDARALVFNRPKRNPFTLFVNQLPVPVTEDEVKQWFGSAAQGVASVKIPINHYNKQQKAVAFIEFESKESMDDALSNHLDALRDAHPRVAIAEDRSVGADGDVKRPFRGTGRGGSGRGFNRGSFGGVGRGSVKQ